MLDRLTTRGTGASARPFFITSDSDDDSQSFDSDGFLDGQGDSDSADSSHQPVQPKTAKATRPMARLNAVPTSAPSTMHGPPPRQGAPSAIQPLMAASSKEAMQVAQWKLNLQGLKDMGQGASDDVSAAAPTSAAASAPYQECTPHGPPGKLQNEVAEILTLLKT